ncbi:hypothetical protein HMI56_001258 [Coelomomyces lativittatus]|nr:hypothetical protein HMI56_001258 [Coelomomyces lativittatus]
MTESPTNSNDTSEESRPTFERSTEGFSAATLDRSVTSKFKLETYYKNLLEATMERQARWLFWTFFFFFFAPFFSFTILNPILLHLYPTFPMNGY